MGLVFHRLIRDDLQSVLAYYRREGGDVLAERFHAEFEQLLASLSANPARFHRVSDTLCRANFRKFPYHLLYREVGGATRILVLRHHRRDPKFGLERR